MNCTNQHSLELKNFHESFRFHREIFLVSGTVKNSCLIDFIEIRRVNDGAHWRVPLFGKSFKQLIRLITNCDNNFELVYCNCQLNFTLNHESIANPKFDVQPIYIVNENDDGKFQSPRDLIKNEIGHALVKISLALELAQCVLSSKFNESNFEQAFVLQPCQVFQSDLDANKARNLNQWELYDIIAKELVSKKGPEVLEHRKFVGFLSFTKFDGLKDGEEYSYANIKSKTSANPALGGGFLCLMGSGCFYSFPNDVEEVTDAFRNKRPVPLNEVLDDSNYRKTFGGCFATNLGTLIHEMGHCFDLAHTETGLMGNDIDYVNRFFLSENFTEILPKRNVRSCQLMKESEGKIQQHQRFTRIKKSGGTFLEKYREQKDNDLTFFELNCLATLRFHRWFTQSQSINDLAYDESERKIKSNIALKIVEIRELDTKNSMLVKFWSLVDEDAKEFEIPSAVLLRNVTLFAMTSRGDVLKKTLE